MTADQEYPLPTLHQEAPNAINPESLKRYRNRGLAFLKQHADVAEMFKDIGCFAHGVTPVIESEIHERIETNVNGAAATTAAKEMVNAAPEGVDEQLLLLLLHSNLRAVGVDPEVAADIEALMLLKGIQVVHHEFHDSNKRFAEIACCLALGILLEHGIVHYFEVSDVPTPPAADAS